jgi:hypothetical protein
MHITKRLAAMLAIAIALAAIFCLAGCGSGTASTPGSDAVINSDGIITATIEAIRPQANGFPWELDVLVQSSVNIGDLPNPAEDHLGEIITVKTDQDMTSYNADDMITAKLKYVGDVPQPGITLYMYNVTLEYSAQ